MAPPPSTITVPMHDLYAPGLPGSAPVKATKESRPVTFSFEFIKSLQTCRVSMRAVGFTPYEFDLYKYQELPSAPNGLLYWTRHQATHATYNSPFLNCYVVRVKEGRDSDGRREFGDYSTEPTIWWSGAIDGRLIEKHGPQMLDTREIGPGRRYVILSWDSMSLNSAFTRWRDYVVSGEKANEKVARLMQQRLGAPKSFIRITEGEFGEYAPSLDVVVSWFPTSGTSMLLIEVSPHVSANPTQQEMDSWQPGPNGNLVPPAAQTRRALVRYEDLIGQRRYTNYTRTTVSTDGAKVFPSNQLFELLPGAWNDARAEGARAQPASAIPSFPMPVTLTPNDEQMGTFPAVVTLDMKRAGPMKGIPLFNITASMADPNEQGYTMAHLAPKTRSGYRTRPLPNATVTFGPFTQEQLMAGYSMRNPGDFEMSIERTGRTLWSGWRLTRSEIGRILTAYDARLEQGLQGWR